MPARLDFKPLKKQLAGCAATGLSAAGVGGSSGKGIGEILTQRIALARADLVDVRARLAGGGCDGCQDAVDACVHGHDIQGQQRIEGEAVHGAPPDAKHQGLHARDAVDDAPA